MQSVPAAGAWQSGAAKRRKDAVDRERESARPRCTIDATVTEQLTSLVGEETRRFGEVGAEVGGLPWVLKARVRGVAWSAPSPSALHLISDVSPAVRRQLCKAVTWCVNFRIETSLCQTCKRKRAKLIFDERCRYMLCGRFVCEAATVVCRLNPWKDCALHDTHHMLTTNRRNIRYDPRVSRVMPLFLPRHCARTQSVKKSRSGRRSEWL